ncbi:MAG: hypothetical protein OXC30_06445 [Alphaproteobacteria bacterium]|nr:hypothetical protein [Alphaproteobacteria bacterium]
MKVIIPLYFFCSMLSAGYEAQGSNPLETKKPLVEIKLSACHKEAPYVGEDALLACYKEGALVASYEGGPRVLSLTPRCTSMKGYMDPNMQEYRTLQSHVVSRAYIDALAAQGASQLREKVQPELDDLKTVAINFMVRGGLPAIPSYIKEFETEIDARSVHWAPGFINVESEGDDTDMVYGDITVIVNHFVSSKRTQSLALRFIASKVKSNARVIFQFLMDTQRSTHGGSLDATNPLYSMHSKLNPQMFDITKMIAGLERSVVQKQCWQGWVVLPYAGDMPGVWADVHDGLDPVHKDAKLIVTPAIVYCNADAKVTKADCEFALCQSNRSDLYLTSPSTKNLSKVVYTTIVVFENELGKINYISKFLHMKTNQRDLLEAYSTQKVVMVLSEDALADKRLVSALSHHFQMPVNSKSLDLSCEHPQLSLYYQS